VAIIAARPRNAGLVAGHVDPIVRASGSTYGARTEVLNLCGNWPEPLGIGTDIHDFSRLGLRHFTTQVVGLLSPEARRRKLAEDYARSRRHLPVRKCDEIHRFRSGFPHESQSTEGLGDL